MGLESDTWTKYTVPSFSSRLSVDWKPVGARLHGHMIQISRAPGFICSFLTPPLPSSGFRHMMHNICYPVNIEQLLKTSSFRFLHFFGFLFQLTWLQCVVTWFCTDFLTGLITIFFSWNYIIRPQVQNSCIIFFSPPKLLSLSCGSLTPVQLSGMFFTLNNNIRYCLGFSPLIFINLLLF